MRTVSAAGARAFHLARAGPVAGRVAGVFGEALALEAESGEIFWLDRRPDALSSRGLLLRGPLPVVTAGTRWRWENGWLLAADARRCRQAPSRRVAGPVPRGPGARAAVPDGDGPAGAFSATSSVSAAVRQRVATCPAELLTVVARSGGRALVVAVGRGGTGEAEAAALLGLGPGLTPSGDDYLGGFLLSRARLGHADSRLRLLVRNEAARLTHPISAAKLLDAESGESTVAEARFLDALLSGTAVRARSATARLLRFGATSGADFALGAVEALDLEGAW